MAINNMQSVFKARFKTTIETNPTDRKNFAENLAVQAKLQGDNPVADLPVESLFALTRLKNPITAWTYIFFFVWTPIGIPLMLVRILIMGIFLIMFYGASHVQHLTKIRRIAPKLFVNLVFPLCGLFHRVRGMENKNAVHLDKCIFVSNHLSNFDPIWFNCIFSDFTLLCAGDYDWFWEAMKKVGVLTQDDEHGKGCIYTRYFGTGQQREDVRIAIEEDMARVDARPFLIYPEGCVTNGYNAVMQYQKFVFGLNKVIVPVCLQFVNPWPFEHYTLNTGAATHLAWYMFSPGVIMKHAILPPQKIKKGEDPTFFALRIQCMTAAHLGLGVIKLNWKQKERLAQALGFQPYNPGFWSRRESMDDFRKAVYSNALVVSGDEIVKTESRTKRGSMSFNKLSNTMRKKHVKVMQTEAAFLAKEFAVKHNERDEELLVLDQQMEKIKEANDGVAKRVRSLMPGAKNSRKHSMVMPDLNAEFVEKINSVRRRNSIQGQNVELMETFSQNAAKRNKEVVEYKRRNSLGEKVDRKSDEAAVDHAELMKRATELAANPKGASIDLDKRLSMSQELAGRRASSMIKDELGMGDKDMNEVLADSGKTRGSVIIDAAIEAKKNFIAAAESNCDIQVEGEQ